MDPWITSGCYEGRRTEGDQHAYDDEAVQRLIAALPDLKDFGTVWVNKAGAITIPAPARAELGLGALDHLHVIGSPMLGVAIVVGPRRSARETLEFLLGVPSRREHAAPATKSVDVS